MKITVQFKQQDEEEPKCTQYLYEPVLNTPEQQLGMMLETRKFILLTREVYAPDAEGVDRIRVLVAVDSIFRITEGWLE